ncbi:unnamed protein product [Cuscuta epithymum]|uniref:Uncharacterized protein n=1 Tax=Cuscuta epithymum TaxID=186058 RepID=A0AAV0CK46_9ASTE|nr:unnamed protein product [Cuscuta epithymum]
MDITDVVSCNLDRCAYYVGSSPHYNYVLGFLFAPHHAPAVAPTCSQHQRLRQYWRTTTPPSTAGGSAEYKNVRGRERKGGSGGRVRNLLHRVREGRAVHSSSSLRS